MSSPAGFVLVEVADDGIGGAETSTGSGLHGIADRVESLGGWNSVTSPVGGGTRVRASIPVHPGPAVGLPHPETRRNGFTTKPVGSQRPSDISSEQSGS